MIYRISPSAPQIINTKSAVSILRFFVAQAPPAVARQSEGGYDLCNSPCNASMSFKLGLFKGYTSTFEYGPGSWSPAPEACHRALF